MPAEMPKLYAQGSARRGALLALGAVLLAAGACTRGLAREPAVASPPAPAPRVPHAPRAPSAASLEPTSIARWQDGKAAAVSITYDDGSANQFRVALPIMTRLGLPATFFVITGDIVGSSRAGRFVGRPFADILAESTRSPTSPQNFLERATAVRYAPTRGREKRTQRLARSTTTGSGARRTVHSTTPSRRCARGRRGPRLRPRRAEKAAAGQSTGTSSARPRRRATRLRRTPSRIRISPLLDEPNLVRELEESRDELRHWLGPKHTFSIECPYGIEDPRALRYALARYPLARNRVEDSNVDNIDRASDRDPATSRAEYVFWQRGPLQRRRSRAWRSGSTERPDGERVARAGLPRHRGPGLGASPHGRDSTRTSRTSRPGAIACGSPRSRTPASTSGSERMRASRRKRPRTASSSG